MSDDVQMQLRQDPVTGLWGYYPVPEEPEPVVEEEPKAPAPKRGRPPK